MNAIQIYGGKSLYGQIKIQGSKNAVLPILAATLLIDGTCEIKNCPHITDVGHMLRLLESLGCQVIREGQTVKISTKQLAGCDMPSDSVCVMRSSITLLGALLARMGSVNMQYPGGCVIGKRPIDLHLQELRKMGVIIEEREDGFYAAGKELIGTVHRLPFVSVGATENLLLAAVLAKGKTVIENAAKEPEIIALCDFLKQAGAWIDGVGTSRLVIQGVSKLYPVSYHVPADRIVAGTYLAGCLCCGGEIFLKEAPCSQMQAVIEAAKLMGAKIGEGAEGIFISTKERRKSIPLLQTDSYPKFPTDLQSAFLAALTLAEGTSTIKETIFENRFRIVPQLRKMGAEIWVDGNTAQIKGVEKLHGAMLQAEELRGGAALLLACAATEDTSIVTNCHFIERGYENICLDLQTLGISCKKVDYPLPVEK